MISIKYFTKSSSTLFGKLMLTREDPVKMIEEFNTSDAEGWYRFRLLDDRSTYGDFL